MFGVQKHYCLSVLYLKGSPRLHKTQIPLDDQRCKLWPQWPSRCRLMPFFFIELKWPTDENGNTTQYKIWKMSYKTDYKELNFLYFLKTTVDDDILPALHRTRFMPTSSINWHVSVVLNFGSWTCHRVWRLTYGLTHTPLTTWAKWGLVLSRWKHVRVRECRKRGEVVNTHRCDGILLGRSWIRLLGSR
jgi:hypothetical protein